MTRSARVVRETRETTVSLELDLDQRTAAEVDTNLPLLSHFVSALATHSYFSVKLTAQGDVDVDAHHLVEDVGIVWGQALQQALGDRRGVARFGQRVLPMDDALVLCAVDLSGRGQCYWSGGFPDRAIGTVSAEVWPEFFHGLARSAALTLHVRCLSGDNAHHVYEACFKGLGQALKEAVSLIGTDLPSTKGVL
ncbi:MAG: imidazoleglycerol-phosphate dehydratase HisB [Sulfobacillus acidophilus]|uniref:Imidazoleglycerol-phosphate dehydratase n=1 Tax=Sulfobacillus acidophilus TaxID=53633 RepID=A0A2T2WE24_9FIRM|nr:MAG: imidazoleglycerol-phosphate dehydratase HisB [Sulfobacillus acidophilus]